VSSVATVATLLLGFIHASPKQNEAEGGMYLYAVMFTLAVCLTWFRGEISTPHFWSFCDYSLLIDHPSIVVLFYLADLEADRDFGDAQGAGRRGYPQPGPSRS
jgi:hypothetical protein